MTLDDFKDKDFEFVDIDSPYVHNNHFVARVTTVLRDMMMQSDTIDLANQLGFRRKKYHEVMELAAEKGSITHGLIANNLLTGASPDYTTVPFISQKAVICSYSAYEKWKYGKEIKPILVEKSIRSDWYAGTVDALLEIDGYISLLDFKTTVKINIKHIIQLAAYYYLLKDKYTIRYIKVLYLNKTSATYKEMTLDLGTPEGSSYIASCYDYFLALLYAWYRRQQIEFDWEGRVCLTSSSKQQNS